MKVLKIVGGVVALVAGVLVVGGVLLPDGIRLERSIVVDAPACNVHALVANQARFNEYSPWAKMDPAAKYEFSGPSHGVGAKQAWKGEKTGEGSMTITESVPCERVVTALHFVGQGDAMADWTFAESGGKTKVTWGFDGDAHGSLVGRWFNLAMEPMMGPQFESGLADMKKVAESGPKADIRGLEAAVADDAAVTVAYVELSSAKDNESIKNALGPAFGQVMAALAGAQVAPAGMPIVVTTSEEGEQFQMWAAIPIDVVPVPLPDPAVSVATLGGGKAARTTHKGAYAGLGDTHAKLRAWMEIHRLERAGAPWEQFVNDPGNTAEAELLTEIHYPVK